MANSSASPSLRAGIFASLPHDIVEKRLQIFQMEPGSSLVMRSSEYARDWPWMDNIYVRRDSFTSKRGFFTQHFRCRLWTKTAYQSKVESDRRKRVTKSRAAHGCPCTLKIVVFPGDQDVTIVCSSKEGHNHPIEEIEKIPSGLRDLVAAEIANGYPAA